MSFPQFIALCGYPGAGKTTVQQIMQKRYGILPVDDAHPLRAAAMGWFGLSKEQVSTPEGKETFVIVGGKEYKVRDLMAEIGGALEDKFGSNIIPEIVFNMLEVDQAAMYSVSSVRMGQGQFYRDAGGIVIEVVCGDTKPSTHFDEYDKDDIDFIIENGSIDDRATIDELIEQIDVVLEDALQARYNHFAEANKQFLENLPRVAAS